VRLSHLLALTFIHQGELEHRVPKARYKRTDKKLFTKQLARIERREARLRRIQVRLSRNRNTDEKVPKAPQEHHQIAISQNHYEHIGTFLNRTSGDPATKVSALKQVARGTDMAVSVQNFLLKLRRHLLGRIINGTEALHAQTNHNADKVLFKHDRMYPHNLLHINYTTYDVQRSQDIVNASTSHCNVMVLADQSDDPNADVHPFCYARVIGVYHVNVVYVGPGMLDYQPRRMEFLWVRWYQAFGATNPGWRGCRLDCIHFQPVTDEDAFGFIDPSDVLRGCHVCPSFARGKVHPDGRGLSRCARDSLDWAAYYVNRCVNKMCIMSALDYLS
jgi:hypothetical protein